MAFVVIYPIPDYDLHRGCLGRPRGGITPLEAVGQRDRKLPWIAVGLNLVRDLDGYYFFRDIHITDLNRVVDHDLVPSLEQTDSPCGNVERFAGLSLCQWRLLVVLAMINGAIQYVHVHAVRNMIAYHLERAALIA